MSLASKILWSEGLTVGPQQFQQQHMYHEMRLQRIALVLNPHFWGVRAVEWNRDGLLNNRLSADAMSLTFQDGETVDAPGIDSLPAPADLTALPLSGQVFTYYAALPALQAHGGNLADGSRNIQHESSTLDLFTEALSIAVAYLKRSVSLLSPVESRDSYMSFSVARVRRTSADGFEIDPTFTAGSQNRRLARTALHARRLDGKARVKN